MATPLQLPANNGAPSTPAYFNRDQVVYQQHEFCLPEKEEKHNPMTNVYTPATGPLPITVLKPFTDEDGG